VGKGKWQRGSVIITEGKLHFLVTGSALGSLPYQGFASLIWYRVTLFVQVWSLGPRRVRPGQPNLSSI
jgi:hypothetical protein